MLVDISDIYRLQWNRQLTNGKTFDYGQSPEPQSAQVWRNRQYRVDKKELKKNKKYRTLFT